MMFQKAKDFVRHQMPDPLYLGIAIPYFYFHPGRDTVLINKNNESMWKAKNIREDKVLYYPNCQDSGRISKYGVEKDSFYQYSGIVEVNPGDTVVDIGAYVGEFTTTIAPHAGEVLAIEPDPRSIRCLERNTIQYSNVSIEQALLDSEPTIRQFQFGTDPTENSMFGVDTGDERKRSKIETNTLAEICDKQQIQTIDFLKLEAEGAEPEILMGSEPISIQKIAAGVGPERNGKDTRSEVRKILTERNYDIHGEKKNVLFATLNT